MDRSVKTATACGILLGGIILALCFRHQSPPRQPSASDDGNPLVLRDQVDPPSDPSASPGAAAAGDPSGVPPAAPGSSGRNATVVTPQGNSAPPPEMARDYPGNLFPGTSRSAISMGFFPDATLSDASIRRHRIVDGDSLHILAKQYLGSADRYLEIYNTNREVLPSPEVLPIGAELKIPPRRPSVPPPGVTPGHPLLPIPRGSS